MVLGNALRTPLGLALGSTPVSRGRDTQQLLSRTGWVLHSVLARPPLSALSGRLGRNCLKPPGGWGEPHWANLSAWSWVHTKEGRAQARAGRSWEELDQHWARHSADWAGARAELGEALREELGAGERHSEELGPLGAQPGTSTGSSTGSALGSSTGSSTGNSTRSSTGRSAQSSTGTLSVQLGS
jgi:hypothetical protein